MSSFGAKRAALRTIGSLAFVLVIAAGVARANPTLNTSATNTQIETQLQGPGIAIVPGSLSVVYGSTSQFGIFSGGAISATPGPTIGIDSGIFMSTSDANATNVPDGFGFFAANAVRGPNDVRGVSGSTGGFFADPQLTGINANALNDPVVLRLQATPAGSYLKVTFVFASDEYSEYVCSFFNDAFGFFIKPSSLPDIPSNWTNIALLPGTSTPIAVNTINSGVCGAFQDGTPADLSNSAYYVSNGEGLTPASNTNLQYDGLTIPFVVDAPVTAGTTYDLKLAIADVGDAFWDSAVFVKWISSSNFTNDADLELDLAVDNASPVSGNNVVFTLTATNTGQDSVSSVQATFQLPAGFTHVSDTSGGSYDPATGVWSIPGSLAATGGTASIQITATATGSGSVNAFAEITSMAANDIDSTPGNGTQSPVEDDEDTVALTVAGVDVSDAPTSGTSYGSATHIIVGGIQLGANIDADSGSLASANADGDDTDGTDDEDGISAFPTLTQGDTSYTIPAANISLTNTTGGAATLYGYIDFNGDGDFADAGETASVAVANGATNPSAALSFTGFTAVPAITSTFARLRLSTVAGLDATAAATDGEVEDYALTVATPSVDLSLTKSVDNDTPATGDNVTFTLTVTNSTAAPASGVTVRDVLPAGLTFVSATGTGSYDAGAGLWTIGSVSSSSSVQMQITATVAATGDLTNRAEINAVDQADPDSDVSQSFDVDDLTDSIADDDEAEVTLTRTDLSVAGTVFEDNGAGGTAHDGVIDAGEQGLAGVQVQAIDVGNATVYAATTTAGDGSYTLVLPAAAGGRQVRIVTSLLTDYRYVSEAGAGLPGLTNPSTTDGLLIFTPVAASQYTAVDFGQVRNPTLTQDRNVTTVAGGVVVLSHTYTSFTAADVTFSTTNVQQTPSGAFTAPVPFRDTNCNGAFDTGEAVISGAITVAAGDTICVLARIQAASGAPENAELTFEVQADTAFSSTVLTDTLTNTDRVVVGGAASLAIAKKVRNVTQGMAFGTSNTASPGETLEYRLEFRNVGASPVFNVNIFDKTPGFTSLSATLPAVTTAPAGMACSIVTPAGGGSAGYVGPLQWQCTGTMAPGDVGEVRFLVRVDP